MNKPMNNIRKPHGSIAVYGCGGAGINIAAALANSLTAEVSPVAAEFTSYYIDTSLSNLKGQEKPDNSFLFTEVSEDIDGSGAVRKENHAVIAAHAAAIVQRLVPKDLNVVVHSGGGGSGSVIGPSIVSELLARDAQVIVLLVGSTDSKIRIENTIKTIKSYEGVVKLRQRPAPIIYLQNSPQTPREEVDISAQRAMQILGYFYSRQNSELDSRDLYHVLNFQKTTSFKPQVAAISLYTGEFPEAISEDAISVATLATEGTEITLGFTPEYQTAGYFPKDAAASLGSPVMLHLVVDANTMGRVAKGLSEQLNGLEAKSHARVNVGSLLDEGDSVTDSGLVL